MKRVHRRLVWGLFLLLLTGWVLLNGMAYHHAGAMLSYTEGGPRTGKPESLSLPERLKILWSGVRVPRPVGQRTAASWRSDCEVLSIPVPNEVRLGAWYVPLGPDTPLVILFHGYASEKTSLLPEAEAFIAMGCSVLLVDFRGSGDSSESFTTLGVCEATDVAAALRHARSQFSHPSLILFGQSMGAVAILRAIALEQVTADAVILESVFDSLLNTTRNRFRAMRVPAFPAAELLVFWGGVRFGYNGFQHSPIRYAMDLTMPALFLQGTGDPRATVTDARRVFDEACGEKRFVPFPSRAHEAGIGCAPDVWKGAVSDFMHSSALFSGDKSFSG